MIALREIITDLIILQCNIFGAAQFLYR